VLRIPKTNGSQPKFPFLHLESEGNGHKFKLILGPSVAAVILGIAAIISGSFGGHVWPTVFSAGALGSGILGWLLRGRY
jgi:hypothetical protein